MGRIQSPLDHGIIPTTSCSLPDHASIRPIHWNKRPRPHRLRARHRHLRLDPTRFLLRKVSTSHLFPFSPTKIFFLFFILVFPLYSLILMEILLTLLLHSCYITMQRKEASTLISDTMLHLPLGIAPVSCFRHLPFVS